jgi:hypothetical protein
MTFGRWRWVDTGTTYSNLPAGQHTFKLACREDGARIDGVYISTSGDTPLHCITSALFEAEAYRNADDGPALAPFEVRSDDSGASSNYLYSTAGTSIPSDASQGQAHYRFGLWHTATIDLWLRTRRHSGTGESVFVSVQGNSGWQSARHTPSTNWHWWHAATFTNVPPGVHVVKLLARDAGVAVDQVYLSIDETPPTPESLYVDAEHCSATAGFSPLERKLDDVYAYGGAYVVWPGTGQVDRTPSDGDTGQAHYVFTNGLSGPLVVWARCHFASDADNEFHYKLEGHHDWQTYAGVVSNTWSWQVLHSYANVLAGPQVFTLLKCEDGAKIDRLCFSMDGSAPQPCYKGALAAGARYVSPWGSDSNPGTVDQPWATVNKAALAATAGQTVYVRDGVYHATQGITVGNSGSADAWIQFVGFPGEEPWLDASAYAYSFFTMTTVSYIRVQNLGIKDTGRWGFLASLCDHVELISNRTLRTGYGGINASGRYGVGFGHDIRVIGNTIADAHWLSGSEEAITLGRIDGFEIAYNEVYGTSKEGIDVKGPCRNGTIHHNYVHDVGNPALYADCWSDPLFNIAIYSNVIHDAEAGVRVGNEGGGPGVPASNIWVHHNVAYAVQFEGIGLPPWNDDGPRADVTILNNTVHGCPQGVHLATTNATDILIRNNIISDCAEPIKYATGIDRTEQNIVADYNLVTDSVGFVNLAAQDLRLADGSPAIDAGHPDCYDGDGTTADQGAYFFPQYPPVSIATTNLPDAYVNTAYHADLMHSGGYGVVQWSLTTGALPVGMVLDITGAITGVPVAVSTAAFTVSVCDEAESSDSSMLELIVMPEPMIPTVLALCTICASWRARCRCEPLVTGER